MHQRGLGDLAVAFELDKFLTRHSSRSVEPNLDRLFNDPARSGKLLEMPCNLPSGVIAAIRQSIDKLEFHRYPTAECAALKEKIAAWLKLPGSHAVLLGGGAFPLIETVMQCFGTATQVLTLEPDFFFYRFVAQKHGMKIATHGLERDFTLDMGTLLAKIDDTRPDLIVLSNPHNPTSVFFQREMVEAVLRRAPGVVLVDEVYGVFGSQPDGHIPLLAWHPNLLILRSFSKLGAAGIRFGFVLGKREVVDMLGGWQQPFSINSLSRLAADVIIDYYPEIEANVQGIVVERNAMMRQLGQISGLSVYPSSTNFIVVRLEEGQEVRIHNALDQLGLSVLSYGNTFPLDACLRIGVDSPTNNARTIEVFAHCRS